MHPLRPLDLLQILLAATQNNLLLLAARAKHSDAGAWMSRQV